MKKPSIPIDETTRLKSLHSLKVLDTEPEERFDRITRLARNIFDVPIALVSLVDGNRQWFKSRIGVASTETPRDVSFCGHAIAGHDVFIVPNAAGDERFCDNPLVLDEPSIRFYAGYPLRAPNGARLGTLCIIDRVPREFSESDAETLKDLGEMVEAELFSVTLATTDELTGLTNRRGFNMLAPHALSVCRRNALPATLMLIDLNDFKRINDELGHDAGDAVLRQFSSCLIKSCRDSDIVARLGGDEFGSLIVGSDLVRASRPLDRLEAALAEINAGRDPRHSIRFSAGLAAYDASRHEDLEAFMREADEAMYSDKDRQKRAVAG